MSRTPSIPRYVTPAVILIWLLFTGTIAPTPVSGQFGGGGSFKDRALKLTICAGGGVGAAKISQKIAEVEAQRLKLPPAVVAAQQRQLQIGLAMAFCDGGNAVLNTTFGKMSEKDKKQRQDNITAALADTSPTPRTGPLPDHPELTETITAEPIVAEGDKECRMIKDHLADQSQGDNALIKECRKPPDGKYEVATL